MSDVMKSVLGYHTFQMNDTVCTYRDSHVTVDIASGKCSPIYQCRNGCASPQQTFGCSKKKPALSLRRRFGHGGDGSVDAASAFGAHGFLYDMDLHRVDDAAHANSGAYSLDCC